MKNQLYWKRGAFSTTYQIFSKGQSIGQLHDSAFKRYSDGEIRHKKYRFHTEGMFKQHTKIIDQESNKVIGSIQYNSWMSKAEIKIHDRSYHWRYDNVWQSKWSISDDKGILLNFAGGMTKGRIEGDHPEDLHVLTGLFVTNYYTQVGIAVFVAVLIPIWVSVIN
jgi:hypothetical protein